MGASESHFPVRKVLLAQVTVSPIQQSGVIVEATVIHKVYSDLPLQRFTPYIQSIGKLVLGGLA